MTDRELWAAAWAELVLTTDSYPTWKKKLFPSSSHWAKAKALGDQICAAAPPPPPPAAVRLGHLQVSCYGPLTLPDVPTIQTRYSYVCTQGYQRISVPGLNCVYKDAPKIGTQATSGSALNANYAVSLSEAPLSWYGAAVWNQGLLANVAAPGYGAKWAANAVTAAKAGGFTGVFADDVSKWVWPIGDWQVFLQAAYPIVKAAGLSLVINLGSSSDTDVLAALPNILPVVDGIMEEGLGEVDTGHAGGLDHDQRVLNHLKVIDACVAAGKLYLGSCPADDTDLPRITYGLGILMLAEDGTGRATFGVAGSPAADGQHYSHAVWTASMETAAGLVGKASGPRVLDSSGCLVRSFVGHTVVVNHTLTARTYQGASVPATSAVFA